MNRSLVLAAAAAATLFTATAANASRVNWSIGINVPAVTTYASGGPAYYPAPAYSAYYAPAYPAYYPAPAYSAYYAPAYPAYYPPRVVHAPRPRIWLPPAPPLPRVWFGGHDRWHQGGDRDGGRDRGHDGRVDWRR